MLAAQKNSPWEKYWEKESSLETGEPDPVEEYPSEKRVVSGSFRMLAVTTALFFLPIANGVIGGLIGGLRVGSARAAIMSALGPLLFASCFLWMIYTFVPIPMSGGRLTQIGAWTLIFLSDQIGRAHV